jgi:ATP-binding cassette, subfamily B (MDR/TAP), member 1
MFCGFLRVWVMAQYDKRVRRTTEAAAFACETTAAIRTVASLTLEERVLSQYHDLLVAEALRSTRFVLKSSSTYAISQSIFFAASALGFWYGGNLIANGEYSILNFFICFTETMFGAQAAGNIVSFAPEFGSGRGAAEHFKEMVELQPKIDSWSTLGDSVDSVQGKIEFKDVVFRYPERPDQRVLNGLTFFAEPGQFVALVGSSGCGKSTALALLERFYDPRSGTIELDGQGISTLNLKRYRDCLALVSQDTTLYSGTIRENLCFDMEGVEEGSLEEACRAANIWDFIVSDVLERDNDREANMMTDVATRRIEHTRRPKRFFPIRWPTPTARHSPSTSPRSQDPVSIPSSPSSSPCLAWRVLILLKSLLDEATSSLDTASEKVVEEALLAAAKGRTTIAIAHRLSSIYHADAIFVIDDGRVVESGSHEALMGRKGRYWDMVRLQGLGVEA